MRTFPAAAIIFSLPALGGCSGDLSVLDPAGPAADGVARLWWIMLAGSVVLFLLVMGLFLLTLFRPGFGNRYAANTWIVAGGLLMPVPVLAALVYYAFVEGERHLSPFGEHNPVRIEARAHMWYWEFHYLDFPDAAPSIDVLHLPVRYDVDIIATSDNVIHSLWVPRLGGKVDATPGHATTVRLYADRIGTYGGVCAEYCGIGHTQMRFRVEVHAPDDFRAAISGAAAQPGGAP